MAKNLIIVESPAKAKTIEGYLGKDYKVIATVGHLIDLPKSQLGVDVANGYEMEYVPIYGKKKIIKAIQKEVKKTPGTIFLAQDPDREGEAIAWQVANLTGLEDQEGKRLKRAVFHEITKEAVKSAVKNTKTIDLDLVEAQRGRRILDRLVGYPLSQLLWKKIMYGLSAGRVQSAALRLVVEREDEIRAFVPVPYVTFTANYKDTMLPFVMVTKKGSIAKLDPKKAKVLKKLLDSSADHEVVERKVSERKSSPPAPFTTSTLQQTANRVNGFSAKMTMSVAQQLYQGIDLKGKGGLTGLITYMRTDSVILSKKFIKDARKFIVKKYGKDFLNETERMYKTKSRVAQEAHEAIRPSNVELTPEDIKQYLTEPQQKLYSLIWRRAVATQMKQRVIEKEAVKLLPTDSKARKNMEEEKIVFSAVAEREVFPGYSLASPVHQAAEKELPPVKEGDTLTVKKITTEDLETKPRSRFNDASLVKEMERLGIGRPSTYASIIGTLINRKYAERKEKLLHPTATGEIVCNFLKKNFYSVVDYAFTAEMEKKLDEVANAKKDKKEMLEEFYPSFIKEVEDKHKTVKKEDLIVLEVTDKECRKCGKNMILKIGPYGQYYTCSDKECKTTEPYFDKEKYYIPEEVEKEGYLLKKSRFGLFWAHPDYPKVKKVLPLLSKEICPECGEHLVERKSKKGRIFMGCSGYPNCDYIKSKYRRRKKSKKDSGEKGKKAAKTKAKKVKKKTSKRKNAKKKT